MFAKASGEPPGYFSFNSAGACHNCKGLGYTEVEMSFLDSVHQKCDVCRGTRFNKSVLQHTVKGKNISDVLSLTAGV